MSCDRWPNLVAMFFEQAERLGETPFLWSKSQGSYRPLSWREAADRAAALASSLKKLGVARGDRVVIVSENRPEWLIADIAIMACGGITAPAYTTNTIADHVHILENSAAKGAIVSTRRLATRFLPAAHKAPSLSFVVAIEDPALQQDLGVAVHRWDDLIATGGSAPWPKARWKRDDVACIIYTSGTGGAPKGVMLSHGALLHNCAGATEALLEIGLEHEVFLSFLPLSHSYEHTAGQFFPIAIGAQIYYAEGVETLAANLIEARPTIMVSVPRLYDTLRGRILRGIEKKGGLSEKLFKKTVSIGERRYRDPKSLALWERAADPLLTLLVRRKAMARFGGRLKAMVSGGGPLNPEVGLFFQALGLRILQGYGQTESGPVVSVNPPSRPKLHTVGPPIRNTEVRIAEDGEILVRGELVMKGYWQDPALTERTIIDGWLHTGDVGVIDGDGHLQITDRKKDIIVNSGGDNISPQRVEGMLSLEPEIAQAMVMGDRRPHLVGLLVPDAAWLASWAAANGKSGTALPELRDDPDLHKVLYDVIQRVNRNLSSIERVRRFAVAAEPFTIENGQMTPTLKVRRHAVCAVYGKILEDLYN